jgi:hypothetical protein
LQNLLSNLALPAAFPGKRPNQAGNRTVKDSGTKPPTDNQTAHRAPISALP